MRFGEHDSVPHPVHAVDHSFLAFHVLVSPHQYHFVVGSEVPPGDAILDLHEFLFWHEVGGDGRSEFTALSGGRLEVTQPALKPFTNISSGHGGRGRGYW